MSGFIRKLEAYFQGGGGINEPTPNEKKYPVDKAIVIQPRFEEPFYKNYDYADTFGLHDQPQYGPGSGYAHINDFKSIKEFLDNRRKILKDKYVAKDSWIEDTPKNYKERLDKMKIRAILFNHLIKIAIDFPLDQQWDQSSEGGDGPTLTSDTYNGPIQTGSAIDTLNDGTFPGTEGQGDFESYPYAAQLGMNQTLPQNDFEGKSFDQLDYGNDYSNQGEDEPSRNPDKLTKLIKKYLSQDEIGLFGLPDGTVSNSDLDAEQTIQTENPYTGISDIGTQPYEDKWNI